MADRLLPRFVIKDRAQKGGRGFGTLLSEDILRDICRRLTGEADFAVEFDTEGYNIGRLAMLYAGGTTHYVSVSDVDSAGRNSSFQSFPSALSRFVLDKSTAKDISFYVHPDTKGNFETDYFIFMYRLMKTAGVRLINLGEYVAKVIAPFAAPEDAIAAKDRLRAKGKGNRSTYVIRSERGEVEVYGKTYGANKYETTLLCLALVKIAPHGLRLNEVEEGGLKAIPAIARSAILASGSVSIRTSTTEIETAEYLANNSLRSIRYIYNLLEKFERKRCAFCACAIPQIVQGAHIWPVASIKASGLPLDDQLRHALDGHNGLWLCENHHALFDAGVIYLAASGRLKYRTSLGDADAAYLRQTTTVTKLGSGILDPAFLQYLGWRNEGVLETAFAKI